MTKRVQIVRHTTTNANAFTGREGEITVDTTVDELRVHDGVTAGGHRVLNKTLNDALYQPLDGDLTALAALDSTGGLLAKTTTNTYARRTITGTAGSLTVTNGDGISGNPTLTLPATLTQNHTLSGDLILSGANSLTSTNTLSAAGTLDVSAGTFTLAAGQIAFASLTGAQALDAGLTSISGLTTAADKMIYTTALDTYAVADLSSFARTILDDANAAAVLTTLGAVIGTNVQAFGAVLDDLNTLGAASADGEFIVATGAGAFAYESGATARTSLGLAIDSDVQAYNAGISSTPLEEGKHTIWIPAAAMRPTTSNGCAAITDVETTAGRPDLQVLDFDASSDEHAQFQIALPKSWNLGTLMFQGFWTSTATDTDGVAIALQAVACADDDTADVAYGTAIVVTDDNISAAEDVLITAESAAMTVAGSPAADELVFFRVFRDVSDANDDMTEDMRLVGIKLFVTLNAGNDA